MATFDVYVEGPADPEAIQQLAAAMAARYGLPAAELVARLTKGRVRVKGNIDRETAETYARDLEAIGARATVASASPATPASGIATAARESRSSLPPATSSRPPPSSSLSGASGPATMSKPAPASVLPPAIGARPSVSALSAGGVARTSSPIASGLSAAFTEQRPASNLGALDQDLLTLSALDGSDNEPPSASFGPPAALLPASTAPSNPFAPPTAADEVVVELAADEIAHRAQIQATNAASQRASEPLPRVSSPSLAPRTRPAVAAGRTVLAEAPRWRFVAGVLLAVGLGFAPAHLVAANREEAKFAAIDKHVIAVQTAADTPEAYAALDKFRAGQIERKLSERRKIAFLGFGIWAGVAALLAFLWFRVLLRDP